MNKPAAKSRRIPTVLWLLLPGFLGFLLFYILPFFLSMGYSVLDKPVNGSFVGLKNFLELFTNKAYLRGLFNTLRFIALSVPLNMALSLSVSLLIHKLDRYKELFSLIFLIPLVIPSGSMVSFWKAVFGLDGAVNGFLHAIGIAPVNWLDGSLAMVVMVVIFVWKNMGYNMVLFLSGLSSIPKEQYEAARVDGAGKAACFFSVTVPGLAPTFVLVSIMSIINSFKVFKEIYLITGSYPHESIYTLQHFMNNMFSTLNYPKLTAATTVLALMVSLFAWWLLRQERKASA